MDAGRFVEMTVDGENLAMYDGNDFQRDTAVGVWNQRWVVFRKWCAEVLTDARFADMLLIRS